MFQEICPTYPFLILWGFGRITIAFGGFGRKLIDLSVHRIYNGNILIKKVDMKYFVACPNCGQDLLKAENGSLIEISCPECNTEIIVEIENDKLTIQQNSTIELK